MNYTSDFYNDQCFFDLLSLKTGISFYANDSYEINAANNTLNNKGEAEYSSLISEGFSQRNLKFIKKKKEYYHLIFIDGKNIITSEDFKISTDIISKNILEKTKHLSILQLENICNYWTAFIDFSNNLKVDPIKQYDATDSARIDNIELSPIQKFPYLFNKITDGFIFFTKDQIIDVNLAAIKLFGYDSKEEFINAPLNLFVPEFQPNGHQSFEIRRQALNNALRDGIYQFEFYHQKKNGELFLAEITLHLLEQKEEPIFLIVLKDITNLSNLDKELKENLRKINNLVSNFPGVVYRCLNDTNWSMEFLSDGTLDLTGYEPKTFLNNNIKSWNSIILPEYQDYVWQTVQTAIEKKQKYIMVFPIETKNGNTKWVYEQGSGVFNDSNKLIALEGYITDITQLKETEKKLEAQEALLKSVIDHIPFDFWVRDKNNVTIFQSKMSMILWGNNINNIYEKNHIPPDIYKKWEQNNKKAFDGELIKGYVEYEINGEKKLYEQTIAPVFIKENIENILGFNIDLTEQKKAENALIESEKKYRSIFENSDLGIFKSTITGKFLDVNQAFANIFGYKNPEEVLTTITDIQNQIYANPETRIDFIDSISLLDTGVNFESEFKKKDHSFFIGHITLRLIKGLDGKPEFLEGFIEDVSERKKLENDLKISEENFKQISENIEEAFWIAENGKYLYCNSAFKKFWHYSLDELNSDYQKRFEFIHEDDIEMLMEELLSPKYTIEKKLDLELRVYRPQSKNEIRWIWFRIFPIYNSLGEVYREIGVASDVTVHKQSELEFIKIAEQLETRVNERTYQLQKTNFDLIEEIKNRKEAENKIQSLLEKTQESTIALQAQEEELMQNVEELQTAYDQIENLNKFNSEMAFFYEQILDAIPYPIAVSNNNFNFTFANNAVETLVNKEKKDLYGKPFKILDFEIINLQELEKSNKNQHIVKYHKQNDDEYKIDIFKLSDTSGKVNGHITFMQNISAQIKAEQELKKSEQKFANVFKLNPNPMSLTKKNDGSFVEVNEEFCQFFKLNRNKIIGSNAINLKLYKNANDRKTVLEAAEKGISLEIVLQLPDLSEVTCLLSSTTIEIEEETFLLTSLIDINQRKKLESALKISEKSFRNVFNSVLDGIFIHNLDGEILDFNDKIPEMFHLERDQVKKMSLYDDFWSKKNQFNIIEGLWRLVISGKHQRIEWQAKHPIDGTEFWVELFMQKVIYNNDDVILTSIRDISDRRAAEKIIWQNQHNLQTLFASIGDLLFVINEDGSIIESNTFAENRLGYTHHKLTSLKISEIIASENIQNFNKVLYTIDNTKNQSITVPLQCYNGKRIETESRITKGYWNNDKVYFIAGRDITDRLKIEQELRESEEKFKLLAKSAQDGVIMLNENAELIYWNPAVERIFGINSKSKSKKYISRISEEISKNIKNLDIQNDISITQTDENIVESFITNSASKQIPVEISLSGFLSNDKYYAVGIIRDISKRKEAELEIHNALEREKELNLLKSQFVSTVSHEFRTPLTVIYSNIELLEKSIKQPQEKIVDRSLNRIISAVKNMTSMLDEISFINRDESGKLIFNPEVFQFENLIEQIIEEIFIIFGKDVQINVDYFTPIGSVWVDKKLFRQIIVNLLSNAIKYSDVEQKVNIEISIEKNKKSTSNSIKIVVADQGIGIPTEDLVHIFEPFHRATNVTHIKGTGLGMSIVKRCVELHNGTINIESKLNIGTTITVTIPLVKVENEN